MIRRTRGQEEMVGFVAVVVLVLVIVLVFLGLALRTGISDVRQNTDVYHFLSSVMETTSDCALGYATNRASVQELAAGCVRGTACVNGRSTCVVLNQTLEENIRNGFRPGPTSPVFGARTTFRFSAATSTGASTSSSQQAPETLLALQQGTCAPNGAQRGATYPVPLPEGNGVLEVILCE